VAPRVYVDTAFLVGLIDQRDRWHRAATDLVIEFKETRASLVTTDAVVLEVGNFFCRSPLRAEVLVWIDEIRGDGSWTVLPLDRWLLLRGEARYRAHADKTWSLVDCISMEVMQERKIHEVATADRHFEQAGFRILMRA